MEELSLEQACFIIVKAREFDVKVEPVIPDPASNPSDDHGVEIISDFGDSVALDGYPVDAIEEDLTETLQNLNAGEMAELLALVWLGRGDYADWDEAVAQAKGSCDDNAVRYLMGTLLLGDFIQNVSLNWGFPATNFRSTTYRLRRNQYSGGA